MTIQTILKFAVIILFYIAMMGFFGEKIREIPYAFGFVSLFLGLVLGYKLKN